MKLRLGFVSNSSSSSFTILKSALTAEQIDKIKNHVEWGEKLGIEHYQDEWEIKEDEEKIHGWTSMDNFDMHKFFVKIGFVPNIEWDTVGMFGWEDAE